MDMPMTEIPQIALTVVRSQCQKLDDGMLSILQVAQGGDKGSKKDHMGMVIFLNAMYIWPSQVITKEMIFKMRDR